MRQHLSRQAWMVLLGVGICGLCSLFLPGPALADPPPRCFVNGGLRDTYTIRFQVKGAQVSGAFTVEDDADNKTEYPFTGVLRGKELSIRFGDKHEPPILAKKRPIVWKLTGDSLQIPIYGQNYQTKKYSTYDIKLDPCPAQQ